MPLFFSVFVYLEIFYVCFGKHLCPGDVYWRMFLMCKKILENTLINNRSDELS